MTPQIRAAVAEDAGPALALAARLEEGVSPWRDRAAVAAAVRGWVDGSVSGLTESATAADDGESAQCFVAEVNGRVAGFISVAATTHWSGTAEAYVGELMVAEEAEGQGIGRALVEHAAVWGRSRACSRIALETGANNDRAINFYRALSFQPDEVRLSRAL